LVAFGETSISACNDSHSSQATSTLGNTPNLNIGFQTNGKPHKMKVIGETSHCSGLKIFAGYRAFAS